MFPVMNDAPDLDEATADRMLEGGLAPDDAPQGYQDVARALHDAAQLATQRPTEDAGPAVAAFLAATPTRRTARMHKWKIAAAALAGGLTLSTGLAAADVLPGPAQDVASSALSHVGINVPGGSDDDSTKVSTVDDDTKPAKTRVEDEANGPSPGRPENHGSVVSDAAQDDSNVGADHGAAVCTTASDGKCKAGETRGRSGSASTQSNSGHGSATSGSSNSSSTGATNSGGASTSGSSNSSGGGSTTNSGSSNSSGGGSSVNSGSTGSSGSSSSSGTSSSSGGSSSSGSTTGN